MVRRVQMVPVAALAAAWLLASGEPVRTQGQGGGPPPGAGRPQIVAPDRHDTSPALRDLPVIPPSTEPRQPFPPRSVVRGPGRRDVPTALDPVLQTSGPMTLAPSSIVGFDGVNNRNLVLPPDTNGDIGPNHYVQWVNLSYAIYERDGTLVHGPADGRTIWQGFQGPCATENDGDPIVLYDEHAGRWLLSQFALPNFPNGPFYQCIAVSTTSDPTGSYHRYQFQFSRLNDYPKFGVWPDGYYMSINQYTCTLAGCSWAGQGVAAFDREKMLAGLNAGMVYFDMAGVDLNLGGMLPSDLDGANPPEGSPNYFMLFDDDAWGYTDNDQLQIWKFKTDWTNPSTSTFTPHVALGTAAFDSNMCSYSRSCIRQAGTSRRLDAIADRLMYRLQYRNFGSYATLVTNHTVDVNGSDQAGVRWYEVRLTPSSTSIHQQGTFAPDANSRWMGSAAMDARGNIAIGYNISNSTLFPRIGFTGRRASDPLGQMTMGEGDMGVGSGGQTSSSSRWGDYSLLAVDPSDGCTFWFTTEYYAGTSSSGWRTRIGSFRIDCGGAQEPVAPAAPSGLTVVDTTTTTADLSWTDNSNNETGFVLERCAGSGCSSGFIVLPAIAANTTAYTDAGLSQNATYGYRLKAVNGSVSSAYTSPIVYATTDAETTPPPDGTMTIGSLTGTGVKLSGPNWQARVTIAVVDSNNQPVSGATVSGAWSAGGTGACTTVSAGSCSVTLNLHNRTASVTFTVNGATHATLTYVGGAVTQVTVVKP